MNILKRGLLVSILLGILVLAVFAPAVSAREESSQLADLARDFHRSLERLSEKLDRVVHRPSPEKLERLADDFRTALSDLEAKFAAFVDEEKPAVFHSQIDLSGVVVVVDSDVFIGGAEILKIHTIQPWVGDIQGVITNRATLVFLPSGAIYGLAFASITGTIAGRSGSVAMIDAAFIDASVVLHPGTWRGTAGELKHTVAIVSIDHPPDLDSVMDFVIAGRGTGDD